MAQDELIQIKVSPKFKRMLKKVSKARGLPLSTYIKFILSGQLKDDPLWNSLESIEDQTEIIRKYIEDLGKGSEAKKKISKKEAKEIISKT